MLIFDIKLHTFPSRPPLFTFLLRTFYDSYSPLSSLGLRVHWGRQVQKMGLENQLEIPPAKEELSFFLRHSWYIHFQVSVLYLEEVNRKMLFYLVVGKLRKENLFGAEAYSLTSFKVHRLALTLYSGLHSQLHQAWTVIWVPWPLWDPPGLNAGKREMFGIKHHYFSYRSMVSSGWK